MPAARCQLLRRTAAKAIFCPWPEMAGTDDPRGHEQRTKATTMTHLIDRLKRRAKEYTLYRRTRDEIARMPRDVALDLNIYPGDADRIARRAVWG